jgi:Protein of unknown function (DUF3237)
VRLVVRADDDALVLVTYEGIRFASPEGSDRLLGGEHVPYTEYYLRVAPFFQTSAERYDWLNRIVSVGVGRGEGDHVIYGGTSEIMKTIIAREVTGLRTKFPSQAHRHLHKRRP